jgi:hypothetical protein
MIFFNRWIEIQGIERYKNLRIPPDKLNSDKCLVEFVFLI